MHEIWGRPRVSLAVPESDNKSAIQSNSDNLDSRIHHTDWFASGHFATIDAAVQKLRSISAAVNFLKVKYRAIPPLKEGTNI